MTPKNKKNKIVLFIYVLAFFAFACLLMGGSFFVVLGQENEVTEDDKEEAEEKEDKVDDLEAEKAKLEKEKQIELQKKLIVSSDINQINANIAVIENKIAETEKNIDELKTDIEKKQDKIEETHQTIGNILREINQADAELRLTLLGGDGSFSQYFLAVDLFQQMEEKLSKAVKELKEEKKQLEEKKKESEEIVEIHDDQKNTLEYEQSKKYAVLNQTQAQINIKESEIENIQAKIAKLKSDISSLLGKGYDADDIKDAAKFASKATGVRKDFLMGMLVIESDLGRYTGGCDYKESRMSSYRKEIFKDICEELDYNYKKMKVSCPPASYSGTGGAMGVAQFMSDTWAGYKSSIAKATGHDPPDPWSLVDGVTAMALKLAKVSGVTSHKESAECDAAKLYLSGTTSSKYNWYCDKVLYWADHYEDRL